MGPDLTRRVTEGLEQGHPQRLARLRFEARALPHPGAEHRQEIEELRAPRLARTQLLRSRHRNVAELEITALENEPRLGVVEKRGAVALEINVHEAHEHDVRAEPRGLLPEREEHLVVSVCVNSEVHRLDRRMQNPELLDPGLIVADIFAKGERVAEGRDPYPPRRLCFGHVVATPVTALGGAQPLVPERRGVPQPGPQGPAADGMVDVEGLDQGAAILAPRPAKAGRGLVHTGDAAKQFLARQHRPRAQLEEGEDRDHIQDERGPSADSGSRGWHDPHLRRTGVRRKAAASVAGHGVDPRSYFHHGSLKAGPAGGEGRGAGGGPASTYPRTGSIGSGRGPKASQPTEASATTTIPASSALTSPGRGSLGVRGPRIAGLAVRAAG